MFFREIEHDSVERSCDQKLTNIRFAINSGSSFISLKADWRSVIFYLKIRQDHVVSSTAIFYWDSTGKFGAMEAVYLKVQEMVLKRMPVFT